MDWKDLYDDNNKLKVPLRRSLAENKKVLGILFENCGDVVQKSFAMERAEGMLLLGGRSANTGRQHPQSGDRFCPSESL